jgi:hypothetical protein
MMEDPASPKGFRLRPDTRHRDYAGQVAGQGRHEGKLKVKRQNGKVKIWTPDNDVLGSPLRFEKQNG